MDGEMNEEVIVGNVDIMDIVHLNVTQNLKIMLNCLKLKRKKKLKRWKGGSKGGDKIHQTKRLFSFGFN